MERQRSKHFINLQEYAKQVRAGQNGVGTPIYGRSEISVKGADETKATKRITELLRGNIRKGIFNQCSPDQVLDTAIFHERTGLAFINTKVDYSQWFMHAKVLATDGKGRFHHVDSSFVPDSGNFSIISGICLFSAPGVRAIGKNGNSFALTDPGENPIDTKIIDIEIDRRLQPYEAEAVGRLTRVIRGLNKTRTSSIYLSVPNTEYWYYTLDAYEQGFIDGPLMLRWFTEVDQRAQYISNQLRKRVPNPVYFVSPLDSTREFLVDAVSTGKRNLIPKLTDILRRSTLLWKIIIASEIPERFIDFAYQSYTIGYLDVACRENNLMVAVENPEEIKIIDFAQKLLENEDIRRAVNPPTVTCLYPHANVVLNEDPEHGQRKRYLYFMGINGSVLNPLREIMTANLAQ